MQHGLSRRATALLILLLLVVPAAAVAARLTVYFAASFDPSGAPGTGAIVAEVGDFGLPQPVSEFALVGDPAGGWQLSISDQGTAVEAFMAANFKKPFKGTSLETSFCITALQSDSPLVVTFTDDSDTGMIDLCFDEDGDVSVDGQDAGHYAVGVEYRVRLAIIKPFMGQPTWMLRLEWGDGESWVANGSLDSAGWTSIDAIRLWRPAGSSAGTFLIDDLRAVSMESSFK